jgi:hypothetical protein
MLAEHKCRADILRVTTTLPGKPTNSMTLKEPRKETGANAQKCPPKQSAETKQSGVHARKTVEDAHTQISLPTKTVQKNPRPITTDPALFECFAKDCQFAGWTSLILFNHQQKMHSVRRFSCWPCKRNFRSDALLQAHVQRSHPLKSPDKPPKSKLKPLCPDRRVRCPMPGCGRLELPGDKKHKCGQMLACEQCDKLFSSSLSLKNHMMSHTGVYMFVCSKCGIGCTNYKEYTFHLETHNLHHPYECDKCDYTSKTIVALRKHIRRHHRPEAAVLPVQVKVEEVNFD